MLETLKAFLPAWAFALIAMVLTAALAGLLAWQADGDTSAVIVAVLSSILGVGALGAKALSSNPQPPPSDPASGAPVTP